MKSCDILLLQETWLFDSQFVLFREYFPELSSYSVSGIKQYEYHSGRPYGGLTFLYKSCKCKIVPIMFESKRLLGLHIDFAELPRYIFNVYMPCDLNITNYDIIYNSLLTDIAAYCDINNVMHYMIGGDFNTDISRTLSHNTINLLKFIEEQNLKLCVILQLSTILYTFESDQNGAKSLIDHFIVSKYISEGVLEYTQIESIDNLSDHLPISITINCNFPSPIMEQDDYVASTPQWSRANEVHLLNYKYTLDCNLQLIDLPVDVLECSDMLCIHNHKHDLETFHNSIVDSCMQSAMKTIPLNTTLHKDHAIPGWDEELTIARQKSLFWHMLWKCMDKPPVGIVFDIMQSSRHIYHYKLRKLKRNRKRIVQNRLGEAIASQKCNDFWREIKKIKGQYKCMSTIIDDANNKQDIANLFSMKYKNLYNSVPSDPEHMRIIESDIIVDIEHICCTGNCMYHFESVTREDVKKYIHSLRSHKCDGVDKLMSQCLLHSTDLFTNYVFMLFKSMLYHGFSPSSFLKATMIPIIKDKRGDCQQSDNYRAIALSNLLGKVFDRLILHTQHIPLKMSDYQFGYKAKSSTIMCTNMLLETLQYFTSAQSEVYALFIDASKAFDRVSHDKLFPILRERSVCPAILRLLFIMYSNSSMCVRWSDSLSETFSVQNGVRQGGVISPVLYNIYTDNLLVQLKNSGMGCYINGIFSGALGYADDLVILAPSLYALRSMISICEKYAKDYDILYNAKKSKLICFNVENPKTITITLCNKPVEIVDNVIYLGNFIGVDVCNRNVESIVQNFWYKHNCMKGSFNMVNSQTLNRLHSTYCLNFYGSELFNYNCNYVNKVYVAWRKAVRQVYRIDNRTHNYIVYGLSDNIEVKLHRKLAKYIISIIYSDNQYVSSLVSVILKCSSSPVAENYRLLSYLYNILPSDWENGVTKVLRKIKQKYVLTDVQCNTIAVIKELIDMRDDISATFATNQEIEPLLLDLCRN